MQHPLVTTPRREALADQLEELIALGDEIARNAVDAISLMGEDRYQDALDTVSLTHYPIADAAESWRLLVGAFADNGLKPGEAPEQSDEDRQATLDTLNRSARAAFAGARVPRQEESPMYAIFIQGLGPEASFRSIHPNREEAEAALRVYAAELARESSSLSVNALVIPCELFFIHSYQPRRAEPDRGGLRLLVGRLRGRNR